MSDATSRPTADLFALMLYYISISLVLVETLETVLLNISPYVNLLL